MTINIKAGCEKLSPKRGGGNLKPVNLAARFEFLLLTIIMMISTFSSGQQSFRVYPRMLVADSIALPPAIADASNEFSGLQVKNSKLYFLAESRLTEKQPAVIYYTRLRNIKSSLSQQGSIPEFNKISISGLDVLEKQMPEFEGLEAFIIRGKNVYLTVETSAKSNFAYIIKGRLKGDSLHLDRDFKPIRKPQKPNGEPIHNAAYEALTLKKNKIIALYEFNYFQNNFAYIVAKDLKGPIDSIAIDKLPFRISDATRDKNHYTAINIFYKGGGPDTVYRVPATDTAAFQLTYNGEYNNHTRLIKLQNSDRKISWQPFYSIPDKYQGYNWEGLAKWKKGYFMINDKYTPLRPYHSILLYLH